MLTDLFERRATWKVCVLLAIVEFAFWELGYGAVAGVAAEVDVFAAGLDRPRCP
jgi:hypothetical protein